jgi:aconitate hydratase
LTGESAATHQLDGTETFSVHGLDPLNRGETVPRVTITAIRQNGESVTFEVRLRIDTPTEADYYRHGGVLNFVLRQLAQA